MTISIFELFSIGIGPSSSHTVGPMRAAYDFILHLQAQLKNIHRIHIKLYGSLALTGQGHATDKAILMGLMGEKPETINPTIVDQEFEKIQHTQQLDLFKSHPISFNLAADLFFDREHRLDYHSNGLFFAAYNQQGHCVQSSTYYSIGGGFIINDKDIHLPPQKNCQVQYPFDSAAELLEHCHMQNLSISQIMFANELTWSTSEKIKSGLINIANIMHECIDNGCTSKDTILPGKLQVPRRAPALYRKLISVGKLNPNHPQALNWLNLYAMAVNEENAAGGRIVTAPTNGAAGIIPAALEYCREFYPNCNNEESIISFLLTAGAIGILYKKNASISGAEMGCQGEVGVACSMAAAACTAILGGTVAQVENAAEIGMEHNLGLTCDPVAGLVQIPCIERNAMGSVKAINAAQLALYGNGEHKVSLDMVINTMREIGHNMSSMYKETSQGGLAVNVPEC